MRYERQSDRDEEARISAVISDLWRCKVHKLPDRYTLDYCASRGGPVIAGLEIKARKRALEQYDDVFVTLNKVFAARQWDEMGLPSFFVVQFTDCLAYADLRPKRRVEFRGREDRGDWQDQQPIVCIPTYQFKVMALGSGEIVRETDGAAA